MRAYIRTSDGAFDGTYAKYYTIDRNLRVWSVRSRKYLLPDMKGRVFLSVGGRKVRVPVRRLLKESLLRGGRQVNNFTNECTREMKLGPYRWRIGADTALPTVCYHYFFRPQDRLENPAVEDSFMSLITMHHLKKYPPRKPTFTQLLAWCGKYADGLLSLRGDYDLYRDLGLFCPQEESMLVAKEDAMHRLVLHTDGAICVMQDGKMVVRRPRSEGTLSRYASTLLANNRLTFKETAGLISGPFKPLLTQAFRGSPRRGHMLFNITGNEDDFSAANYTWVKVEQEAALRQMRTWLTRRWYYEVLG